jgi:hypothetical protein
LQENYESDGVGRVDLPETLEPGAGVLAPGVSPSSPAVAGTGASAVDQVPAHRDRASDGDLTDELWGRILAYLERENLVLVVPRRERKFRLELKVRARYVAT